MLESTRTIAKVTRASRPPRAMAGGLRLIALGLLLACAAPAVPVNAADVETTKADMVWNLAKFVQWPEGSMSKNNGQLVVTILGEDDFAATLANQLSSRTVNGKPVFVRFAQRAQDIKGSNMVYISAPELVHVEAILEALKGTPVLTLADSPGFASKGGMVNFSSADGRVRFEIHMGHTEQSGLKISSRLLALARVIDGGH